MVDIVELLLLLSSRLILAFAGETGKVVFIMEELVKLASDAMTAEASVRLRTPVPFSPTDRPAVVAFCTPEALPSEAKSDEVISVELLPATAA